MPHETLTDARVRPTAPTRVSDVAVVPDRTAFVRRGLRLNYLTLSYNVLEAGAALAAGLAAASVSLPWSLEYVPCT